jgi:hypothetical protein
LGESYRNLFSDAQDEDDYQIEKAKNSNRLRRIYDLDPVKVYRKILPQSSSDYLCNYRRGVWIDWRIGVTHTYLL